MYKYTTSLHGDFQKQNKLLEAEKIFVFIHLGLDSLRHKIHVLFVEFWNVLGFLVSLSNAAVSKTEPVLTPVEYLNGER